MAISVKIKKEKKVKDGDKWLLLVKVCNEGTADQKVVVTSWPYDGDSKKMGAKKDRQEQTRTIKAGKCEWFVFEYDTEPKHTYTDVYDADKYDPEKQTGGFLDGVINDLAARKIPDSESSNGYLAVVATLPYPNRLAYTGEPMEFYIESVTGIPSDWKYEMIHPRLGETYTLEANEKEYPGVLLLRAPQNLREGTSIRPRIKQRISGMPDEPEFVMNIDLHLVADKTAPELDAAYQPNAETGTIQITANALDKVSGIREVNVEYSTDGGKTWSTKQLTAPLEAYLTDGPAPASFSGHIGPFRNERNVLVQVVAIDEVGNTSRTGTTAQDIRNVKPNNLTDRFR